MTFSAWIPPSRLIPEDSGGYSGISSFITDEDESEASGSEAATPRPEERRVLIGVCVPQTLLVRVDGTSVHLDVNRLLLLRQSDR